MDLNAVLLKLVEKKGSDLHLKVGRPPLFRLSGDLLASSFPVIQRTEMQEMLFQIMPAAVKRKFEKTLEADFAHTIPNVGRFRVNVFVQQQDLGAVFRFVPLKVPSIDSLGLPEVFKDIANYPNGLVVVTGPTGSGKSTTLAAIMQNVNRTRPVHIITIEDPVEFIYTDELATINQRELGLDTYDLLSALKAALRQDPDVLLMGEMRDQTTMEFALTAAETGHLVFSTLHTNDAKQTIDRIINAFSKSAFAGQVRTQLAMSLRAVICQRLVKRADGTGMVPAIEILVNSPNVKQLLLEGSSNELEKVMDGDTYYKMQTFNRALLDMVKQGIITEQEALATSSTPDDLKLGFRGVSRGSASGELSGEFRAPSAPEKPTANRPTDNSGGGSIQRGFQF